MTNSSLNSHNTLHSAQYVAIYRWVVDFVFSHILVKNEKPEADYCFTLRVPLPSETPAPEQNTSQTNACNGHTNPIIEPWNVKSTI